MIDTLVKGGKVAMPDGSVVEADVLVVGGKVAGVQQNCTVEAAEIIDATGRYVIPGIIDTHVHIGFDRPAAVDFETESRCAALGGVTTMLRYYREERSYEGELEAEIELGDRTSHIDWGIHLGLLLDEHLDRIPYFVNTLGIRSFKMYTCYKTEERPKGVRGEDDGFIREAFERVGRVGEAHINVHCENEEVVLRSIARVRREERRGRTDLDLWSDARPSLAEAEAIRRVAFLARGTGCPLYVVHVTSTEAAEAIAELRQSGYDLYGETCIQYLSLDTSAPSGLLCKVNPPVRPRGHQAALWKALRTGVLDTIGTDHAATVRAVKGPDTWSAAPGFGGMGTLLPALLHYGVNSGEITIGDLARLQARAADIFRLSQKGRILPGKDADLVVVDLHREQLVDPLRLQSSSDYSIYEGETLKGWPILTMQRGRVIARNGQVAGAAGQGRYLSR